MGGSQYRGGEGWARADPKHRPGRREHWGRPASRWARCVPAIALSGQVQYECGAARPALHAGPSREESSMFISPAYAQAFGDSASTLVQFAPFVLIFVVFYFFVIRPQQQKTREHRNMLGALRRGDRGVTA